MKKVILTAFLLLSFEAFAAVPACSVAQLNSDGMPTSNYTTKEFRMDEKLIFQTPNGDAELIAFWNDSFGFYQMTLSSNGVVVNSVIEKPATGGMLNLWVSETLGYTAQCRFEL